MFFLSGEFQDSSCFCFDRIFSATPAKQLRATHGSHLFLLFQGILNLQHQSHLAFMKNVLHLIRFPFYYTESTMLKRWKKDKRSIQVIINKASCWKVIVSIFPIWHDITVRPGRSRDSPTITASTRPRLIGGLNVKRYSSFLHTFGLDAETNNNKTSLLQSTQNLFSCPFLLEHG